jgi:hydroxypyruvate reductase
MPDARALLRTLFDAALEAADPRMVLPPALPAPPRGRCVVVGAGKSAALMAQVVHQAWPDVKLSGVVVTRYGHAVPAGRITVLQASHPVPDANGQEAARAILAAVDGLTTDDLVLALISGGGSALMVLPAPGFTLAEKQAITRRLLHAGATIAEINTIRRRLSAIKGGRLAAACGPARVVTLAISDVPGDDPALIASGPTWAGSANAEPAEAILARYGIDAALPPDRTMAPRTQDSFHLIATPALSLEAAARAARAAGIMPLILGDALQGEAREAGRVLAGIALSCRRHGHPAAAPAVLLSGGETTVTIGPTPPGSGGRNMEFALALALELDGAAGITALACDTDGIDGTEDAAGAIVTPDTLARGPDARARLEAHDSYSVFAALGDLVVTGPTLTNVNDFRAILIE